MPDSLAVEVNEEKGILAQSETTPNFIEDLNTLSKPSSQASEPPSNVIVSESSLQEIHVKKGDVLEKIAKSCNISVQDLIKLNKLSSTNLHIGQVLKVPVGSLNAKTTPSQPQPTSTPQNASTDPIAKYYVVKPGDNPWTIAVKNHMKVEELLKLNNMDEAKARKLKPGDQIRIR
ncbi:MAG: LysM peptidoglycan-binding domain-containing protein [Chlamydiae bacterium]|nr:LysM peptidoglycan-binding domain-containing protein [Chlamydiota bacterium]